MSDESVLVLCPPNTTAPVDGPNGLLGDRIHQIPAVKHIAQRSKAVFVWPDDFAAQQIFNKLSIEFLSGTPDGVAVQAKREGISRVHSLFSNPSSCPPGRRDDCRIIDECVLITQKVNPEKIKFPTLDPLGHKPLWKQLLMSVAADNHDEQALPWLIPDNRSENWAKSWLEDKENPLVIWPIGGKKKQSVPDDWWRELAERYTNHIIVPVHESEVQESRAIFHSLNNVSVIVADILQTAALAAAPHVNIIGNDGGRMTVMAAAHSGPVLCIFGRWPASTWALPNMITRNPTITPVDALSALGL